LTRKKIDWFLLNRQIHRDIGYLCIGLTIIFAISGIALNHIHSWNPNYIVEQKQIPINQIPYIDEHNIDTNKLMSMLDLPPHLIKSNYWASPDEYKLFLTNDQVVTLHPSKSLAIIETVSTRPFFYQMNFLHLNKPKKLWTYISDIYAILLTYLALSSLFMIKGRLGFKYRGAVICSVGIVVPLIILLVYEYS